MVPFSDKLPVAQLLKKFFFETVHAFFGLSMVAENN